MTATTTHTVNDTEDAVALIGAMAVKTIAGWGLEGHSLDEVGERVLADDAIQAIRRSFTANLAKGFDVKESVIRTGQSLIAHYCNSAGIPTGDQS